MRIIKEGLLTLGLGAIVFGGMAALPGQELFVFACLGIGASLIGLAALVDRVAA